MRCCTKITSGHNFCGFTDLVCYCIFSKDNLIHKGNQVNDTEAHIVYHSHTTSICEDSGKNFITNYIAFITRRLLNRWNARNLRLQVEARQPFRPDQEILTRNKQKYRRALHLTFYYMARSTDLRIN